MNLLGQPDIGMSVVVLDSGMELELFCHLLESKAAFELTTVFILILTISLNKYLRFKQITPPFFTLLTFFLCLTKSYNRFLIAFCIIDERC